MNVGKTLFARLMEFVPRKIFGRIVVRHEGDRGVRTLSCLELFRVLAFAQLSGRESGTRCAPSLSDSNAGSPSCQIP